MTDFLKYEEFLLEKQWTKAVESSHLVDMEYDSETNILKISFSNGSEYEYYDVPTSVFRKLADERNLFQNIGHKIVKGVKYLFGKDTGDGTYGTRFWALIRKGKYKYKKIK